MGQPALRLDVYFQPCGGAEVRLVSMVIFPLSLVFPVEVACMLPGFQYHSVWAPCKGILAGTGLQDNIGTKCEVLDKVCACLVWEGPRT